MRKTGRPARRARQVVLDIAVRQAGEGKPGGKLELRFQAEPAIKFPKLAPLRGSGSWHVRVPVSESGATVELFVDGAPEGSIVSVAEGGRILARGEALSTRSLRFLVDPLALKFTASDAPRMWEGRVRLDVQEASGKQARQIGREGWRGRVLLRQSGSSLTGFLDLGTPLFPVDGEAMEEADGATSVELHGTGWLGGRLTTLALNGVVQGDRLIGGYGAALVSSGAFFSGKAFFDVLMCPNGEPQGPAAPPVDPCGRLLWTSETYRGEFGPEGARRHYFFRVLRFERCVRIEYLDDGDNVIGNSELAEDLKKPLAGGKQVLVYDCPLNDQPVTPPGDGQLRVTGEAKVIIVQGCALLRFEQYVRESTRIERPDGTTEDRAVQEWDPDGTPNRPYNGTFQRLPADSGDDKGGMSDLPGLDAQRRDALTQAVTAALAGKPDGTKFITTFEAETFICCDGNLLGIVAWGYTLTWTVRNGAVAGPVAAKTKPKWLRQRKDTQSRANVRCQ